MNSGSFRLLMQDRIGMTAPLKRKEIIEMYYLHKKSELYRLNVRASRFSGLASDGTVLGIVYISTAGSTVTSYYSAHHDRGR